MAKEKPLKILFLLLIFIFLLTLVPKKISLVSTDLGRHIKNGQIFTQSHLIPKTNFYSYTYKDFPFVNHHWGSGLIFYLTLTIFNFNGLSFLFLIIFFLTLFFFLKISFKYSSFNTTIISLLFSLPLIINRSDLRPEIFSYLLASIFYYLLYQYQKDSLPKKYLLLLPLLTLIWINLHVYFFLGFFLITTFIIQSIYQCCFKKKSLEKTTNLFITLFSSILISLLNPNFIKGLTYPLKIFENYGYRVLENQSILFLEKIIDLPIAYYYIILTTILIASWIVSFKTIKKNWPDLQLANLLISIFFVTISFLAVRNTTVYGFFALPIISINLFTIKKLKNLPLPFLTPYLAIIIIILYLINPQYLVKQNTGYGLLPNQLESAQFFKDNNLSGPIFNNYDIGSFLIYSLYPNNLVYIDNRPEAYPFSFFQNDYINPQQDEKTWQKLDKKYNFQTIYFYRHDLTPWAQQFLISKLNDSNWIPVYVDGYTIIFLKDNSKNQKIIEKYALPNEIFSVSNE